MFAEPWLCARTNAQHWEDAKRNSGVVRGDARELLPSALTVGWCRQKEILKAGKAAPLGKEMVEGRRWGWRRG